MLKRYAEALLSEIKAKGGLAGFERAFKGLFVRSQDKEMFEEFCEHASGKIFEELRAT